MHFFRDYLECAEDVAGLLANLICYDGHLPTGSSVSPIVSYFAFKPLFDSLYNLATDHNLIMTCYVDDITMSGPSASASVLHEARKLIFRAGLRAHKDRQFGSGPGRMVTGVIVGNERLHLPFSRWKKIRADVRAISGAQTVAEKLAIYPRLTSRLYEAAQIDPCCRALAEYHHHQWKALKRSASEPALQAA
jgi:RNA-directed DNA polymerase